MRTLFEIIKILFKIRIVAKALFKRVDILFMKDFRNVNVKTLFDVIIAKINIAIAFLKKVCILKNFRKISLLIAIIITKIIAISIMTFRNYFC